MIQATLGAPNTQVTPYSFQAVLQEVTYLMRKSSMNRQVEGISQLGI